MDNPSNSLLGRNGQSSNELLNLLIHGRAVSNFFNDSDSIDDLSAGGAKKGPTQRNDIGFLSSVDRVGSYYTTPKYTIWVVRLGDHFGLVFSMKKDILSDWKAECTFNLFFIEPVSIRQDQLTRRLTICNF